MKKIKKIFIIGGHGKSNGHFDSGAVAADGTTEREIVRSIAQKILPYIGRYGIEIGIEEEISLQEKTKKVNEICKKEKLNYLNSLLISVHADWKGAPTGVAAYYYEGDTTSFLFAKEIAKATAKAGKRNVKWVKPDTSSRFNRLGIIRDTMPLACLVEVGSLKKTASTKNGLNLLKNEKAQEEIAKHIANAVLSFAKLEPPEKTEEEKVLHFLQKAEQNIKAAKVINKKNKEAEKKMKELLKEIKEIEKIYKKK